MQQMQSYPPPDRTCSTFPRPHMQHLPQTAHAASSPDHTCSTLDSRNQSVLTRAAIGGGAYARSHPPSPTAMRQAAVSKAAASEP